MFGKGVFLICGGDRSEARWQRSPCRVAVLQVEAFEDGLEVMFLGHVELPSRAVPVDVETEEVAGGSRVGALKLSVELSFEFVQGRAVVAGNELVVNMHREHEELVSPATRVEAGVCFGWSEALGLEPFVECLVEAAWGLLQTVERFAEVKDLVGGDVASFRWGQVDCLLEITVEEGRFDVDLVAFKIQVVDQREEEDSDGVLVRDSCVEPLKSIPSR